MVSQERSYILFFCATVAFSHSFELGLKGIILPASEESLKLVSNLSNNVGKGSKEIGGLQNDQGIQDSNGDSESPGCYDWQGKLVPIGEKYSPDTDMCNTCICDKKHFPISCHSVLCLPPSNCLGAQLLKGFCCEYECKGDTRSNDGNSTNNGNNNKDDGESITNLSLRLIASTVTSFLVLALLLFMVHRLRQRRLLQAMRRFEARSRQVHSEDTDSEPYIPDGFMSVECPPYTDPPPPYSPPKPPQIMPGEQPPPYEEIHTNNENVENRHNSTTSGNNPEAPGSAAPAAATIHDRGPAAQIVSDAASPAQLVNSRHQRSVSSGGGPLRAQNSLPAYASTDVIDGLGVVISPGNDLVSYSPYSDGWAMWLRNTAVDSGHERTMEPFTERNFHSVRDRPRSLGSPSACRMQAMPTITAFQRFSNIFKRDSWKARNRRRNGRPVSEYSNHHHYATIPRNEILLASGTNHQEDGHNPTRQTRNRPPDRMCMSYYSPQEAYMFGPMIPSTSSSNSSSGAEPPHQHYQNSSAAVVASSAISPPGRGGLLNNDQVQSSISDRGPHMHDISQNTAASRPLNGPTSSSSWTEGRDSMNGVTSGPGNSIGEQTHSECRLYASPQRISDGAVGRETTPQRQLSTCVSPSSNNYQSLASFIKSNPSTSLVNSRDHVTAGQTEGFVQPEFSMLNSREASEYLEQNPSPDVLPKFFSTFPLKNFEPTRPSSGLHEVEERRPSVLPNKSASGSSLSSSPSPTPPTASSTSGMMRRSLSAVSQTSIFSVCSETGEKKLKNVFTRHDDSDAKVLSGDAQYPDYRSLPMTKTSNQSSPMGASSIRSTTNLCETSQHVPVSANQDYITGVNSNKANEHLCEISEHLQNVHPSWRNSSVQSPVAVPTSQTQLDNTSTSTATDVLRSSPTGVVADEDNYNLNSIVVDKSPLNKELPSLYNDHLLDHLSPMATGSTKTGINPTLRENQASGLNQLDNVLKKSQEAGKKSKKKRVKERSAPSPQFAHLAKAKQSASSPKHVRVHLVERKAEETADDKVKSFRVSDKKLKTQFGLSKPTVRFSESHNASKLMTRSFCDGAMAYGNADVYRSVGADSFPAALSQPLQTSFGPTYTDPWVRQDHQEFLAGANRTVLNDLNQPPNPLPPMPSYFTAQPSNYLKPFETCPAVPAANTLVRLPEPNLQLRKKTAHRRSSEKFNASSPSRHKTRPKSLAATSEVVQDKKDPFPRSTTGAGDAGAAGRGAKSGFGYDLNFVDQNRISDWFGCPEPEFTHKRCSAHSHDAPYHNINVNTYKSAFKADGNAEAPGGISKNIPVLHPGNKSGLSNELSFVIRGAGNPGRSKKRQSVPASVSTFLPQNHLDRTSAASGNVSKPDEGEVMSKVRGDKASHTVDRMTVSDDYSEATSYV